MKSTCHIIYMDRKKRYLSTEVILMQSNNYIRTYQKEKENRVDNLKYADNRIRQAAIMFDSTSINQIKQAEEIINYWGKLRRM